MRGREVLGGGANGSGHLQLSDVSEVTAANRPDLGSFQCRNRSRVTVKRYELNLVSLSVLIDVNHRTDISRFEPFAGFAASSMTSARSISGTWASRVFIVLVWIFAYQTVVTFVSR